jgi:hypothetical protein
LADVIDLALQIARWAPLVFLAAMTVIVLLKLSGGRLDIGSITLGRGQLLIVTFGVAGAYAYMAMSTVHSGHLPKPSPLMLSLLGGSQGVHLSLKLAENWPALFARS